MARPQPERTATSLRLAAEDLAASLPALLVAAERVAATVAQGVHGRRRVGQGETFWQFRRYEFGDPAQLIDWRQSARSHPLYVRETEWEAAQSVWLWRDHSPSMAYRSQSSLPLKRERADLMLLALASLLVRGGERVALMGQGPQPRTGRAALNALAAALEAAAADRGASERDELPPRDPLPRHARVVLFGDLLAPLDRIAETLSALSRQGQTGHLLQVLDPAEEFLPFEGRVMFEGVEGEGRLLVGRVDSLRDDYRAMMARRHDALTDLARSAGWTFAVHHTDRPPETALMSLYLALADTPRPDRR